MNKQINFNDGPPWFIQKHPTKFSSDFPHIFFNNANDTEDHYLHVKKKHQQVRLIRIIQICSQRNINLEISIQVLLDCKMYPVQDLNSFFVIVTKKELMENINIYIYKHGKDTDYQHLITTYAYFHHFYPKIFFSLFNPVK